MPRYRNSLNTSPKEPPSKMSRRGFLGTIGWIIVGGVGAILGGTLFSFLFPNALKIPPSVFSLGRPEDVLSSEGKVFIPKQRAFVEVSRGKVRCQTAICTHLGCTVNAVETGFKCPCHGSTYDLDGLNTGGPAPLPLLFYKVYKGAAGDLLVDKSQVIQIAHQAWFSPK